jgi:hypothetical protein
MEGSLYKKGQLHSCAYKFFKALIGLLCLLCSILQTVLSMPHMDAVIPLFAGNSFCAISIILF